MNMKTVAGYEIKNLQVIESKSKTSYRGILVYPLDKRNPSSELKAATTTWDERGWVYNQTRSDCNINVAGIHKANKYRRLRGWINSKPYGSTFTRKEMFKDFKESKIGYSSLDNYRNYLRAAGYLETIMPGVYKIVAHISTDLSRTKLEHQAYSKKKIEERVWED